MKQTVTVIGMGEIGSALAKILKSNCKVQAWDNDPAKHAGDKSLDDMTANSDLVFLCVPSWTVREALYAIVPHLKLETGVIAVSKGLDRKTGKRVDELLAQFLPADRIGLLAGPINAAEIQADLPAWAIFSSASPELDQAVDLAFAGTSLNLEHSTDMPGVALSAVLKNVYALALALAQGLGWKSNATGWLVVQSLAEMDLIIGELGGLPQTARGLAGLGDLAAAAFDSGGHCAKIAADLIAAGKTETENESLTSLPLIWKKSKAIQKRLPVLAAMAAIASGSKKPQPALSQLMQVKS